MKKKILSVILILTVTFGTCSMALAAETQEAFTGADLQSYGKIVYQNGGNAVVIDSEDLYTLAERLDSFKIRVANQLNAMDTYFTTGEGISLDKDTEIKVVHAGPSEGDSVNALEIDFDTLVKGIAASQSVPSDVSAASAENLSDGVAAWVDGELIRGTGADNQSYFDRGYEEGYEKANGQVMSVDFIEYGGDFRVKNGEDYYLGPCDISIPNKDVWLLLAGSVSQKAEISPAPDARIDGVYYLSMLQYRKDPGLPDSAMRTLHIAGSGSRTSGYAAPWYLLYLK